MRLMNRTILPFVVKSFVLAVWAVLVTGAMPTYAHVVKMVLVDPTGTALRHTDGIDVMLGEAVGQSQSDGTVVFLDVAEGEHEVSVSKDGYIFHSRLLYVERPETTLTFGLDLASVVDVFNGPREVAWFGTVYTPIAIDQSDGWQYASGQGEDFFGDENRKFRKDNTTEYLIWETPHLWDFTFELFGKEPKIKDVLIIEGSRDRQSWDMFSYTVEEIGTSGAGWIKMIVRGDVGDSQINFVRLLMKRSDKPQDVQLGQAIFRLLRIPD